MYTPNDVARALVVAAIEEIRGSAVNIQYGEWIAEEAVDSDLSQIEIEGLTYHFVQKSAAVTGLVAGDIVLVVSSKGLPKTILMKVIGDITLA